MTYPRLGTATIMNCDTSNVAGPRDYSAGTRAALATLSRGRCYFPECLSPILRFIDGEPYIDYQIAHIRDARPGTRYEPDMTDDERRAFANLILLCKPHHELIDRRHPDRYAVTDLESWKAAREGDASGDLAQIGSLDDEDLEELLYRSVAESQQDITTRLEAREADARARIEAVLNDVSHDRVLAAFEAADELRLLSRIGVRADAPMTDFYLRIQKRDSDLWVHLDTLCDPSVFATMWLPTEAFADVMVRLAEDVRPSGLWPGPSRWEFATALESIINTLLVGLRYRAKGSYITNAVQLVGDSWLLSDWEAMGLGHQYQITFQRLDESDWYNHLINKTWTIATEVAEMLDHSGFLRDLMAAEQNASAE